MNSKIEVDSGLELCDGSHRLAMAYFHDLKEINCKVTPVKEDIYYGVKWFLENNFTLDEINLIQEKTKEVLSKEKIIISLLLWPPVADYFDEIEAKVALLYSVVESKDLSFSEDTFKRFIEAVYRIDDIEQWKIDKKIEYMSPYREKKVRLILIEIHYPVFRVKDLNKNTILTQGEELKKIIRNCYKGKIDKYFYDIVCHTGDNTEQSEYITKLCYPKLRLSEYFDLIHNYEWMIIKLESPNLTDDFPEKFPFSKDLDIICASEDYDDLCSETISFLKRTCSDYYDPLVIEEEDGRCRIRIELNSYLIYQFDISFRVDGISEDFIEKSVKRRNQIDNYFVPVSADEICYRVNELIHYPNKKYHLDFILSHKESIDRQLIQDNVKKANDVLSDIA